MKTDEDKFSAIWLSHSSISDFLTCPQLYYYSHVYKNPRSGRKITLMNPYLALGQSIHTVFDEIAGLPVEERLKQSPVDRFEHIWPSVSGKKGGFSTDKQEQEYKERGRSMLQRIMHNPGPIIRKALKSKQDIPWFWFSEKDNLILSGKIDWTEYIEETNSIHIIDFKTGRKQDSNSLQLPIYLLLATKTQTRPVSKMSYWYLDRDDGLEEVPIPDFDDSFEKVMKVGQRVKLARQLHHYKCSTDEKNGCRACAPYFAIVQGKGEFVGIGEFNKEIYILPDEEVAL